MRSSDKEDLPQSNTVRQLRPILRTHPAIRPLRQRNPRPRNPTKQTHHGEDAPAAPPRTDTGPAMTQTRTICRFLASASFAFSLLATFQQAHAQALYTADKAADIFVFGGYNYTKPDFGPTNDQGFSAGLDYTRYFGWQLAGAPIDPSLELRGTDTSGDTVKERTLMGGLRLHSTFKDRYHPYIDLLVGIGVVDYGEKTGLPRDPRPRLLPRRRCRHRHHPSLPAQARLPGAKLEPRREWHAKTAGRQPHLLAPGHDHRRFVSHPLQVQRRPQRPRLQSTQRSCSPPHPTTHPIRSPHRNSSSR